MVHRRNFYGSVFFAAVFLLFRIACVTIREDSRFYPVMLTRLGIAASILYGVYSLLKMRRTGEKREPLLRYTKEEWLRIGVTAGMLVAYIVLMNVLGFVAATALFTFSLAHFLSLNKKIWLELIVAVCLPAALYLLFDVAFGVSLPSGLLI